LYDESNVQLTCNKTGIFNNISYGNYCIKAYDSCSDTTIIRCFNVTAPPVSVGNNVSIFNKTCNSFSAAINGQSGLTGPTYCLFDSASNQVACNKTGIFNNLSYGNYCINIKDSCRDTTIQRCFNPNRPMPIVPAVLVPSYYGCDNFGVVVTGDSLTNPRFCIVDVNGNILTCNTTGIFDSLQYGYYCINVYDSCYDTTITRCLSILGPVVGSNITVSTKDQTCLTFTATVGGLWLLNPTFCIYTNSDVLVECNNTGIFYNLLYGTYYVKTRNGCPDTTFTTYFTETPPLPSLDPNVAYTNKTCNSFSVNLSGQQNLNNPAYCLFDSSNLLIACNTTGVFNNLSYGTYCINVKDACYDTTITRCFTASPTPINLVVNSRKSCSYGYARFGITVGGGTVPVNIKIYRPDGSLFVDKNFNASVINIDSIQGTAPGETYKIVATDNCGLVDSAFSRATASVFTHKPVAVAKCPSSTWINGSGSIKTTVTVNTGKATVKIIKRNTTNISINPSITSGGVYTFNNLAPARYIIRYSINDACGKYQYDTVVIKQYQYPNLNRSSAYQCDMNGFTIGAVVSDGLGPFTYEIIGSSPSTPSIVAGPQTNPEFSINNGTTYSLVRLRALDACGNATLQDASILPLANNGISATFNCFQLNSTLSVDTLANAKYSWYRKDNMNSSDSIYLDSTSSIYLPFVLPTDTGIYIANIKVNNGCINRLYYYNLNGECSHYLPLKLQEFTGKYAGSKVLLNWKIASNLNIKKFVIERRTDHGSFEVVGTVNGSVNQSAEQSYYFIDPLPGQEKNYYRIKMVNFSNDFSFSNEVLLSPRQSADGINVYPNPVNNVFTIDFKTIINHSYNIKLLNLVNQVVREVKFTGTVTGKLEMQRTNDMGSGVYFIKVTDLTTNEELSQKVIFR
jgi:Secretion system C-terminal sorting domain